MASLDKEYKVYILKEKIQVYEDQVKFLQEAILENPEGDHPEKPSRQKMLDDYLAKIAALNTELDLLTNQG